MSDTDILLSRLEGRRTDGHSDDMHADAAKAIRDLAARLAELEERIKWLTDIPPHPLTAEQMILINQMRLSDSIGSICRVLSRDNCDAKSCESLWAETERFLSQQTHSPLADGGCPVHSEPGQSHTRATCTCLAGTPGGNLK